mgnify:CR=1 FL=1
MWHLPCEYIDAEPESNELHLVVEALHFMKVHRWWNTRFMPAVIPTRTHNEIEELLNLFPLKCHPYEDHINEESGEHLDAGSGCDSVARVEGHEGDASSR